MSDKIFYKFDEMEVGGDGSIILHLKKEPLQNDFILKECKICKNEINIDNFYPKRAICKMCKSRNDKERYIKNKILKNYTDDKIDSTQKSNISHSDVVLQ